MDIVTMTSKLILVVNTPVLRMLEDSVFPLTQKAWLKLGHGSALGLEASTCRMAELEPLPFLGFAMAIYCPVCW